MSTQRWQQIEEIFQTVVEMPEAERTAFLDANCSGDAELRREIESLLSRDSGDKTAFKTIIGAAVQSVSAPDEAAIGRRFGPYRLTGLIGRGGMAEVFSAVRDDDEYHKQVAIKLVRGSLVSEFMLTRFRHERQILASLEHPHVARLLDGGTTEDGTPFLVMEHVQGQPLTEYCEANRLSIRQRLELFRHICGAVQHAHRNLIIHRDLKPSNILVTADGTPKLLDFGIAKLLDAETSSLPAASQTITVLMTPDYASPEQVRGQAVTTATDVYSLGAILYELLTGQKPHTFRSNTLADIESAICVAEIEPPSVALARTPEAPARLRRELTGDLDNIVLMAMRKEPDRRYLSVEQFSEDLRRYLEGLPVSAHRDTLAYRSGKFVRRHKVATVITVGVFALLTAVAVTMSFQASRIARERDRANQVTQFLVELFGQSSPAEARGNTVTARELLDKGAERVRRELSGQPESQATLMDTIGRVYQNLGLFDSAQPLLEESLALRRSLFGDHHADVAASQQRIGDLLLEKGKLPEAEKITRQALETRRQIFGERHADVASSLNALGRILFAQGQYDEAEQVHRETLKLRRELHGAEHADVTQAMNNLAIVLRVKGNTAEAESLYRQALEIRRRLLGEDHPSTAATMHNLAVLLSRDKGDLEGAEQLQRQLLAIDLKVLGPAHPDVAVVMNNLANTLAAKREYAEAEQLIKEALQIRRKALGETHASVAVNIYSIGAMLVDKQDYERAEPFILEALAIWRKTLPAGHPDTATALLALGRLKLGKGELSAAEPPLRESLAIRRKVLPPGHPQTSTVVAVLSDTLIGLKRFKEAEDLLTENYQEVSKRSGQDHRDTQRTIKRLADFHTARGNKDQAEHYRSLLTSR